MKTFERGPRYESLDAAVSSIAQTYGFGATPSTITRNDLQDIPEDTDRDTALVATLASRLGHVEQTTQTWATAKKGGGTNVVFAAASPKLSIAQAFVVKAALSTVEAAGFNNPIVLISSVGDEDSRKRYVRELGNFFKKYLKDLPEDVVEMSAKDPDGAARTLIEEENPLAEHLPRTIDYLSESSRKIMLETISLFETLEIEYELDARLPYSPNTQRELVFAIEAEDKKGTVVRVASGGRFHENKRGKKKERTDIIGISVALSDQLNMRASHHDYTPSCFVVHVGEIAKMRAFTLLDALWRTQIALEQALLADTIQDQMERAKAAQTKYIVIIGQREALDGTVILKNTETQVQETIPADAFLSRMNRVRA